MVRRFRITRPGIAFVHDVIMAAISFPLSVFLRVGELFTRETEPYLLPGTILFVLVAAPIFLYGRMYRGIWRYASIQDLVAITKAVTLTILIFLPLLFVLTRLEFFPRSLPFINWFVLIGLLGGPRFVYRLFKDRRLEHVLEHSDARRVPILLVGAGDAAELFIRQQTRDRHATYKVIGVIDYKGGRIGREIHGVPVVGGLDDLEQVVADFAKTPPQRIVLTDSRLDGAQIGDLLIRAEKLGLGLARLPRLAALKSGVEDKLEAQPIAVEDLLGRPQHALDRESMQALIAGRIVLVTGAGGTIGSELVRQIADFAPEALVLFDASEFNLYQIDAELAARHPSLPRHAALGDVRDSQRLEETFRHHRPQLVFHAAALKHVPLVEENPIEGVLTNTIGSRNVAEACRAAKVRLMVQISTDKAVNPSNVMGVTKRLAESYCQSLDLAARGEDSTRYVTVRFGNVLASTGSVVPLFQKQIAEGGPLTVTDPTATRFFMTVREAVELVLQASAIGAHDDDACGKIFVLDMGAPVRIVDLAEQMIRLAGMRPGEDVQIAYTGLRPGEKLHEQLFDETEVQLPTRNPHLMLADAPVVGLPILQQALRELEELARAQHVDRVIPLLQALVTDHRGADLPAAATTGTEPSRAEARSITNA